MRHYDLASDTIALSLPTPQQERMLQKIAIVRTGLLGGVGSPPQSGLYPINREKFREIAPLFVAIGLSTAAQAKHVGRIAASAGVNV